MVKMHLCDDNRADWGSVILIGTLVWGLSLVVGPAKDSLGLFTLVLIFFGPALCAWGAAVILRRVSGVPEMPSLLLWIFCLAGSGMPFPIERAVSTRVPEAFGVVTVVGRLLFHFVESFFLLSACGTLIVGLTMVPVLWCVELTRGSFFELVDLGKCLVFFTVLILFAQRALEWASGLF